jgi:hypothetical protein
MIGNATMRDIDFLPIEHQRERRQHRSQTVQIATVVIICALAAVTAFMQEHRRRQIRDELAVIAPVYNAAVSRKTQMNDLEQQWCGAKADAELYTYLRHPWPRTQLLAALISPLPNGITLQEVQIEQEPADSPQGKDAENAKMHLPIAAQRDLARFRSRLDVLPTKIILTGTAAENVILSRYLNDLENVGFFEKADLDCIRHVENGHNGGVVQFRATVSVLPPYGNPRGPRGTIERPHSGNVAFDPLKTLSPKTKALQTIED